jgi:hypothetical protein
MKPFGTRGSRPSGVAVTLRRAVAFLLALGLTSGVGCGDSGKTRTGQKPQRLSAAEANAVTGAGNEIHSYCRKFGLYLARRGPSPTTADSEGALSAADRLIGLAFQKPDALYQQQDPMRLVLDDLAEDLEGTNCGAAIEHKLEQALAALPP